MFLVNGLIFGGGIGEFLSAELGNAPSTERGSEDKAVGRLVFDLLFFVVVTFGLLNLLFGIIVDTFSSLREQSNAKTNIRENKCLVCGLSRQEFERREPGSWRRHYKEEHNIWAYFSFLIHLQTKARTEFSGIENFVEDCHENRSLAWLPRHRALALEDPPTTSTIATATPKVANYGSVPLPLARG